MTPLARLMCATALICVATAAGVSFARDGRAERVVPHPGAGPGLEFAAIDGDGDNALSRAELEARAEARLGALDANADGALDRTELVAARPAPRGEIPMIFARDPGETHVDDLLARMGATESGSVGIAAMNAEQVEMLLVRFDADRDGAISKAEGEATPGPRGHRKGPKGHGGPFEGPDTR